jgi:hypothetical protein
MKAQLRFWRAKETQGAYVGSCWLTLPGAQSIKGGVFHSTIVEGDLYANFGNANKMPDGGFSKPNVVLESSVQAAAQAVVNKFWDSRLTRVDFEIDGDKVKVTKIPSTVAIIEGAEEAIKAAQHTETKSEIADEAQETQM